MGEIAFDPWNTMGLPIVGEVPIATFMLILVLIVIVVIIGAFYKEWKLTTFDSALAVSLGIPVMVLHYLFMTLVSITTVAGFDAVGAIMVVAMMIAPAASAYLWIDRLSMMMILIAEFSVLSAVIG
uniref:metal ABC transporter permease n=1 Tax=Niallia sp. XMNu-256 TaxID=3082444 RepID=UPI00403F19B1